MNLDENCMIVIKSTMNLKWVSTDNSSLCSRITLISLTRTVGGRQGESKPPASHTLHSWLPLPYSYSDCNFCIISPISPTFLLFRTPGFCLFFSFLPYPTYPLFSVAPTPCPPPTELHYAKKAVDFSYYQTEGKSIIVTNVLVTP